MSALFIDNGIVVTMDEDRRVLEPGAVLVRDGRVAAVGEREEVARLAGDAQVIDAKNMAVIPGLIDSHGHAGHAMVKSLGAGDPKTWVEACLKIYAHGSDGAFWKAEARLAALERLKAGVTTSVSLFGGGTDLIRNDSPEYVLGYCDALDEVGLRSYIAMGPNRPPHPHTFTHLESGDHRSLGLAEQMNTVRDSVLARPGGGDARVQICMVSPVFRPTEPGDTSSEAERKELIDAVMALRDELGVIYTQDGHREGSIALSRELGGIAPISLFSHSVDLTEEDMASAVERGVVIVHNPSAIMSIRGRCPVPELLDMGVNVVLGSDGAAPDRGYDMFRHMAQCMHYHRRHFRDASILPAGKVFEMATIDAARGLGRADELGSIEVGKRADIVLVDLFKPHLMPINMPVMRLAHFANAADVDTVIVDGEILMRGRKPTRLDERAVLEDAQEQMDRTIERNNLAATLQPTGGFWGVSRA